MSKEDQFEIKKRLDQWLEYGDIKDLADVYLSGRYRYQQASKIKRGIIRNPMFLEKLIERAISRKSNFERFADKLLN